MTWVLGLSAAALLLAPYVLGPVLVRATQRMAPPAPIRFDPARHAIAEHLVPSYQARIATLVGLGFVEVVDAVLMGSDRSATATRVALLEHPLTGERAIIRIVEIKRGRRPRLESALGFSVEAGPDRTLVVDNAAWPAALPTPPDRFTFSGPEFHEPAPLLQVFRALAARAGAGFTARPASDPSPPLDRLAALMRANAEAGIRAGYLQRTVQGGYQPTWKGAILGCWQLLPPMRQFLAFRRNQRARRLLGALSDTSVRPPLP
jgi:hypothetical protein